MTKIQGVNCNHDEVLPVAQLVHRAFIRDKQLFMNFSPVYNEAFITGLEDAITQFSKLIPTAVWVSENKKTTQDLYDYWDHLRSAIKPLESYLNKAGNLLTADPKDFRLTEIRDSIGRHDHAGIVEHAKAMLVLVNHNQAALLGTGFKATAKTALEKLVKDIEDLSDDKRIDNSDKESNTVNNVQEMRTLWSMISTICADGKIIFAKDQATIKDYTLAHLLELVRQQNSGSSEKKTPESPAST